MLQFRIILDPKAGDEHKTAEFCDIKAAVEDMLSFKMDF